MRDIHAAITERFLEQLRAGCVPWQRPWQSATNLISRKAYRGINSLTLGSAAFRSPFWMTYRQAHELGGHIRKGEKSTPVIYWKFLEKRDGSGNPILTAKGRPAHIPFVRWSNVFNFEQTEGIPVPPQTHAPTTITSLGRAEALVREANLCPIRKTKIKINEMKIDKLFDQAKQDFADYITTLYKSGRYQHVLIAADFWRQIFDEGDYPVSMAQQVNASLEVEGQVQTTVGVFNNNLSQNNIAAATDNLQQAFMLSAFSPSVLGLPLDKKKPIQVFERELSKMQSMIEARDFTDLESLLTQISTTAPDFDSVKAMSIVNAVKLQSQLNLGKAKLAAQQGDLKAAMEDFQAAAEAWPGNPDLKDKALSFFNSEDVQNQSLEEFDRLVGENNYQAIFDKQLAFAPAMKDDPKRQAELKAALEKVQIEQTAVQKATLLQANGDVDGAWETVQLAIKQLPEDIKLNSLRGDLAGKGADFVAAINKAKDAEDREELGYSLSWYAIAQRCYPASQIANQAIERLSKTILDKSGV